jgi:hypothetical protein
MAPVTFYELQALDGDRVGFQVMVSAFNTEDALDIVLGPKSEVPLFVEPFFRVNGNTSFHDDYPSVCPMTKECSRPPRSSYLAMLNEKGALQPGTFITQDALPIENGMLRETWSRAFISNPTFRLSRYSTGCFCQRMSRLGR